MLIAAKYEEIYPPMVKDYVIISNGQCQEKEIYEMEKLILYELEYDI